MNSQPLSRVKHALMAIWVMVFGRIEWQGPGWLQALRRQIGRSPRVFAGLFIGLMMFIAFALHGWHWYLSQPQPLLVTAKTTAPSISPITDDGERQSLQPQPLSIEFGYDQDGFMPQSVAPLANLDKPLTEHIRLIPDWPGEWRWESDHKLIFYPDKDWPADQHFEVEFSPGFFAPQAKMASMKTAFDTMAFIGQIDSFSFYQDPVHPQKRAAVATLSFNYPVDPASLEAHVQLMLQQLKDGKLDLDAEQVSFTLKYDQLKRKAYLQSGNLSLPPVPRYFMLTLDKGIKAQQGDAVTLAEVSQSLLIPDQGSFFKILDAKAQIIRNQDDQPEQVLTIETNVGVSGADLQKAMQVYLLPKDYPATAHEAAKADYQWTNPGEVTPAVLAQAATLSLEALPADRHYATLHSFRFKTPAPGALYLKLDKGLKAFAGYVLSTTYQNILPVPAFPKEIQFLHKGSLLSLASEKKLSVTVRGLPAVKFAIARVLPDNVNQLVTQTQGDFNAPYFLNASFDAQNISQIYAEMQTFATDDLSQLQYTAVDVGKYLQQSAADSLGPNGLFLLTAEGWDMANNQSLGVAASRLLLVTDMGLLVKDNSDGSHDLFVQSISLGQPVSGAAVSVLGKNGLPLMTSTTDASGRVSFPNLNDFTQDKQPVAYLASAQGDTSFIPFTNYSRMLNLSRFDVGGNYQYGQAANRLSAYLFTDRGIYRPGDMAHIGMIVKQSFAQAQPAGLPLQANVIDPRGNILLEKRFTLDETGFLTFDLTTTAVSPTGQYSVNLFVVKDDRTENLLGSTSFKVEEFLPDTLRIAGQWLPEAPKGWISPDALNAKISLANLFGSPASNRRIEANLLLSPQAVTFEQYPDYTFVDPLRLTNKNPKVFTEKLPEATTDDQGEAILDLNLQRFEAATYQVSLYVQGFAAEGGRSVSTRLQTLVSPMPYLLGYHSASPLDYIKQNSPASIDLIAINPELQKIAVDSIRAQWLKVETVTALTKNPDGTYQYQSIEQHHVVSTNPIAIGAQGLTYELPTGQIGQFKLRLLNQDKQTLLEVPVSVVGASQQPLPKNAEMTVKLNKAEFEPGETIELQITAPYTGSGLITLERDKTYAWQWFNASTTSSVQTIQIPADFQGNGYVNVAFVRAWDSPEVFISPLSYNVQPFSVSKASHRVNIQLDTPTLARPGETMTIQYATDKPAKIVVYAVDEGILQVARYPEPDPLSFFFQKQALEVSTQQTLDLILPNYLRDRELSAVGGDGEAEALLAANLNPFKRKTDLPVVYWSGLLQADNLPRQLVWQVPDYFNGSVRVMAVAVADQAVGATSKETKVHGYFVISPNAPTFVAPGDEFDLTATVANQLEGDAEDSEIQVELHTTGALTVVGESQQVISLGKGKEKTLRFKIKAGDALGDAALMLSAKSGDKANRMTTSLSIRPASAFTTQVESGMTTKKSIIQPLANDFYQAFKQREALMSVSPVILLTGLDRYLDAYPFGCTEQLTSKAMPLLAMASVPGLIDKRQRISERVEQTVAMLAARQKANGGFTYWPGVAQTDADGLISLYAMHFLLEARERNYPVSQDLYANGIAFLKDLVTKTPDNLEQARSQAYAIYLLSRNDILTTNALTQLLLVLQNHPDWNWSTDITSAWLAASFQLLKNEPEAGRLIKMYKPQSQMPAQDFFNAPIADAQYLYLVAKHFPAQLPALRVSLLMPLVSRLNAGELNTLLAGYGSLALAALGQESDQLAASLSIQVKDQSGEIETLTTADSSMVKSVLPDGAVTVLFDNPDQAVVFYQSIQSGFTKRQPNQPMQQGIEILREYLNAAGEPVDSIGLGEDLTVRIQVRAVDQPWLNHVAIVDLLPGGFEVVRDSVQKNYLDYVDVREDRVLFFTSLSDQVMTIQYKIRSTNQGQFTVPAILAEAMYAPAIQGRGIGARMTVKGQ